MDITLAAWLVGGGIVAMIMMLVVVTIARGMDKGLPAMKANIPAPLAKALGYGEENDDPHTEKSKKQAKSFGAV
ncbi:MAG TPA: hypothetical protein PLN33_04065, partial [Hyphomonadaceae bacterium]|nr:hypothetical protein [Hyphomonadaceae bacterium]